MLLSRGIFSGDPIFFHRMGLPFSAFILGRVEGSLVFGRISESDDSRTYLDQGVVGEVMARELDPGPGGVVHLLLEQETSTDLARICVFFEWPSATMRTIAKKAGKRMEPFKVFVRLDREKNTIDIDSSWDIDARCWRGAGEVGVSFHGIAGASVTMTAPWSQRPLTAAAVPSRSRPPRGRRKASRQKVPDLVVSMPCGAIEQVTLS